MFETQFIENEIQANGHITVGIYSLGRQFEFYTNVHCERTYLVISMMIQIVARQFNRVLINVR